MTDLEILAMFWVIWAVAAIVAFNVMRHEDDSK